MAGVPREFDLRQTSHFLFEAGSLMLSGFGVLFVIALVATAVGMYLNRMLSTIGALVGIISGLMALLGVGLLYWSARIGRS